MIDEHESVVTIGLKVNHLFCDVENEQIGRLSSDAQPTVSTVSAQLPVILFFLTCSFTEFEEKSSGLKTFGFFHSRQNLRSLERVFHCCSVCETMKDYKEGYLIVWTNYISPCCSIVGLYLKGTCDVISVTMATHKVHKSVL